MNDGDRRPVIAALPAWIAVMSTVVFAVVATLAAMYGVVPGDESILDGIQRIPSTPFEAALHVGNLLGETIAGPIAMVILGTLCIIRRFPAGSIFCGVLLVSRLGGMFLKRVFDSARPSPGQADIRGQFDGLGFPSGHAMTATCIAMACTILLPAMFGAGWYVRAALTVVWALAVLCGLARIWCGAHWPTDVVGGAAVAIVISWFSAWLAANYQDRQMNSAMPATSTRVEIQRSRTSR